MVHVLKMQLSMLDKLWALEKPGRGRDSLGTLDSYFNLMNTYIHRSHNLSPYGGLTADRHETIDCRNIYNFPVFETFTVPGYPKTKDLRPVRTAKRPSLGSKQTWVLQPAEHERASLALGPLAS